MILFIAPSAQHLLKRNVPFEKGRYTLKRFSDGEIYVKIHTPIASKKVLLIGSTFMPPDNLLELFFLIDALKRARANIHLLIPYFGYARQDVIKKGEAFTGCLISQWIQREKLKSVRIITMHSRKLKKFFNYKNQIPLNFYYSIAKYFDVLVSPDRGAVDLTKEIAEKTHLPFIKMKKQRPQHEKVKLSIQDLTHIQGNRLLIIEDMICTGRTIIEATNILLKRGAKAVSVIATHGVFSSEALKSLEKSQIQKIYITNSIPKSHLIKKIKVLNISSFIIEIAKNT